MARSIRKTRVLSSVAAAVLATLTLAGCGATPEHNADETDITSGESRLPAAEGSVEYPLTLESPWGSTLLQERPDRIAVVTTTADAENLLALGVSPVFLPDAYQENPWVTELPEIDGVEVWAETGSAGDDISVELVASADPDLIIAIQSSQIESQYEDLSAIAPVLTGDNPGADITYEESLATIADALDLGNRGEEIIETNRELSAAALDDTPELRGQSLAIVMNHPSAGFQYRSEDPSAISTFIQELGFTIPEFSRDPRWAEDSSISPEQFPNIDVDNLLIFDSTEGAADLEQQEIFHTIPAVQEGKYAFSDQEKYAYATLWPTALSIPYVIEEALKPAFAELNGK